MGRGHWKSTEMMDIEHFRNLTSIENIYVTMSGSNSIVFCLCTNRCERKINFKNQKTNYYKTKEPIWKYCAFLSFESSTSSPGGDWVGGLPPAPSFSTAGSLPRGQLEKDLPSQVNKLKNQNMKRRSHEKLKRWKMKWSKDEGMKMKQWNDENMKRWSH